MMDDVDAPCIEVQQGTPGKLNLRLDSVTEGPQAGPNSGNTYNFSLYVFPTKTGQSSIDFSLIAKAGPQSGNQSVTRTLSTPIIKYNVFDMIPDHNTILSGCMHPANSYTLSNTFNLNYNRPSYCELEDMKGHSWLFKTRYKERRADGSYVETINDDNNEVQILIDDETQAKRFAPYLDYTTPEEGGASWDTAGRIQNDILLTLPSNETDELQNWFHNLDTLLTVKVYAKGNCGVNNPKILA